MCREFDWAKINGVIFDMDGTLYCQKKMRSKMSIELLKYYLTRPHKIKDILIIYKYRKVRELLADTNDKQFQEKQFSLVARELKTSEEYVKKIVEYWILSKPLKYIFNCRYPDIADFISILNKNKIKTGIISDYPVEKKLRALELPVDKFLEDVVCLKPDPSGIFKLLFIMGLEPNECLFIGDRYDRDGACAVAAGMPYLLKSSKNGPAEFNSYFDLKNEVGNCYAGK